uniref:Uncharacterized protein n=1 Tax=Avena sativa TaxID=4498 RepID=A0ACD6AWR9_AVESA
MDPFSFSTQQFIVRHISQLLAVTKMRTTHIIFLSLALLMLSSDVAITKNCGPKIYEGPCDEITCRDWCKIVGGYSSTCVSKGCQCTACWSTPPSSSANSPSS